MAVLGALADELAPADPEAARLLDGDLASIGPMEPRARARRARRRLERHHAVAGATRGERLVLVGLAQRAWVQGEDFTACAELAERALGGGALLAEHSVDSVAYHQAVFALIVADGSSAARTPPRRRPRGGRATRLLLRLRGDLGERRAGPPARGPGGRPPRARPAPPSTAGDHALITPMARAFLVFALVERGEVDEAEAVARAAG